MSLFSVDVPGAGSEASRAANSELRYLNGRVSDKIGSTGVVILSSVSDIVTNVELVNRSETHCSRNVNDLNGPDGRHFRRDSQVEIEFPQIMKIIRRFTG